MTGSLARSARRAAGLIAVAVAALVVAAQAQAATFTVGSTVDTGGCASPPSGNNCTLRQLVNSVPAGSTIVVPASPNNPYMLTAGELSIPQNVTIAGGGARTTEIEQQTSSPTSRVFDIQPGATATISGLSIVFGKADSTSTFGAVGGDVLNRGTLTLSEDQISNGTATGGSGAGISNQGSGATLTVTHSLIEDNLSVAPNGTGGLGGGIENSTTRFTAAHLSIDNSTIVNNTAAAGGGGVLSDCAGPCSSTTTITDSTIASNNGGTVASGPNGGGLMATQGTMSVLNTIVASNTVGSPATPSNCGANGALIGSLGHNLETAVDCGFTAAGDLQNTNPQFLTGESQRHWWSYRRDRACGQQPRRRRNPGRWRGLLGVPTSEASPVRKAQPVTSARTSSSNRQRGSSSGDPRRGVRHRDFCQLGRRHLLVAHGRRSNHRSSKRSSHLCQGRHLSRGDPLHQQRSSTPANAIDVKVSDVPLSATPAAVTAVAGIPFSGSVASFSDGNPLASAADFSATINWGDGTPSSNATVTTGPGGFVVTGGHTYATIGSYPTSISIVDSGGSSTVVHGTATAGAAPAPVVTGKPPSIGGTTAGFTGSLNPVGLATTAFFEYGLDPKYTGAGPLAYTQTTPAQAVGSDFTSHTVSASVTGLVPNALYHVRLVATNSAGTTVGPDVTFTTLKTPPPGSPALGQTFNVTPVSGVVLILVHGQLVPLTEVQQIPKNTLIDALHGTLSLTTALPGGAGGAHDAAAKGKKKKKKVRTQSGTFGGAIFKIAQARSGLATLSIVEGAFRARPPTPRARHTRRPTPQRPRCRARRSSSCTPARTGSSARAAATARRPCVAPSGRSPTAATGR